MLYFMLKLIITAVLIVVISETGKRYSLAGALLAAIPFVSILAMIWMYVDTGNASSSVEFSKRIVWLITPSMTLFIVFPILIHKGVHFYLSLFISTALTIIAYYSVIFILGKFGIKL